MIIFLVVFLQFELTQLISPLARYKKINICPPNLGILRPSLDPLIRTRILRPRNLGY